MNRFSLWIVLFGLLLIVSHGFAQPPSPVNREKAPQYPSQRRPDMDCGALDTLIRHDRYTIGLLEQVYKQAVRPDLKALIQQMIRDHEQEAIKLNTLRKDWYGQSLTP